MPVQGFDIATLPEWNVEWLWQGFIAKRNLTLLSGAPKSGKSTLLFRLLQSMFASQPFLGLPSTSVPTVLLTEESVPLLRRRRDTLALASAPLHVLPLQLGLSWPVCIA